MSMAETIQPTPMAEATTPAPAGQGQTSPLPNRPTIKMPPLPKNLRTQKRPLNRPETASAGQRIVYVGTKSPFMGVVKRVSKLLDNAPSGIRGSSTKGLPLNARIAALSTGGGDGQVKEKDEVLVRGTGRAIAKTLHVAAHFNRQSGFNVSLRTMTTGAVDDVVREGDDAGEEGGFAEEEESRVRMVSCLEVGVSLR